MEYVIEAGIQSYREMSLTALQKVVSTDLTDRLLDLFLKIAKEIDDCRSRDTKCSGLLSYQSSSERQKKFLDGVLYGLRKPHDGIEVVDILEKWGVFSKHENLAIWKEGMQRRKVFSQEIENASAILIKEASEKSFQRSGRTSLLNITSFAIDKVGTKDVDDAISFDTRRNTVLVHIADPGESLNNDMKHTLMKEASKRLLTIYSQRERLPMFPETVSSNLFSLGCDRRALRYATTFEFQVSGIGEVCPSSMQVYSSILTAPVCFSYREASKVLEGTTHPYYPLLIRLYSAAVRRRQFRISKGAVCRSESGDGDHQEAKAHLLVDELMISTNTVAARFARQNGLPVLYRGVLRSRALGNSTASTFRGTRYTCSMHASGTKGRDMEKGANVKLNTWPSPHAGLGVEEYVQATSPIRKFADLIVHFQFHAFLRKQAIPFGTSQLSKLINPILQMERAAARIDRRSKKYWSYHQLKLDGQKKAHRGTLKKKAEEARQGIRYNSRSGPQDVFSVSENRGTEWVVFLKRLKCEITVNVPFRGRAGMEVNVKVKEVNPRTSYLVAYATKAS